MKGFIYICLLLAMPFAAMAQNTKKQGDDAYAYAESIKNDNDARYAKYTEAINIYETVIAEQGGSLPLYYNLGNAYFRINELGKAILNYERALRIDANDKDAKFNLQIAQSNIADKIPQDEVPFYKNWWNSFASLFSKDAWGVIGVITFIGMLVALFFMFFRNHSRVTSLGIAIPCFVITVLANLSAYSLDSSDGLAEAIVMDEMVIIRSSPNDSGTELTEIHEGLKVNVVDEVKDWVKIEADNGNRVVGWVKVISLERI